MASQSARGHNEADVTQPSQPPHDLILNPTGKKMKPFFHVMISYRVSTEAQLARQMFDRLLLTSFKRIPEVGLSQWPGGFSCEKHRPGHANVFLDQVCLKTGENWKSSEEGGGFVGGLLKSLIFVPLLSWRVEPENKDDPKVDSRESKVEPENKDDLKVDSRESKVEAENKDDLKVDSRESKVEAEKQNHTKMKFTGSVGEMVARYSGALGAFVDPDPAKRKFCDSVDNVLLELILAMELHAHLKQIRQGASCMYPCLRMFPIIVDKFPDFSQLPDEISEMTYTEAVKVLLSKKINIRIQKKTVRGVVKSFFDIQSETLYDLGKPDHALDTVCNRIVGAVCDAVSNIDPLSLFESRPLCAELNAFLSKRNCSYMTRILAANNFTSLRQLSFLTHQNAIYDLAKQCSAVSSKSAIAELSTLTSVIEESKDDEASWLLSMRLDRFIDSDASFETVIKSSSGLLISAAQKSWLTLYFLLGIALLVIGAMSVVSSGAGGNTIFDFVVSAFLFGVCLAAKLHSPKRGFLTYCCMWPAIFVAAIIGFCIDFIKNGAFSLDNATRCSSVPGSQLQTSFRTCAIAQIMCFPSLNCLLILLNFYQALNRQDLAWTTYLLSVALFQIIGLIFEVNVLGHSVSSQYSSIVILFGIAFIFVVTEWMNHRARCRAREDVAKDEKMYGDSWKELLEKKGEEEQLDQLTKKHLGPLCKKLNSAGSVEVLQDCKDIDVLYARAEFVNDAFQSLVAVLLESSPNAAAAAKPTSEANAAAETKAAAEAKDVPEAKTAETGLSSVHEQGPSNASPLKKELELFFAEDDIDKILKHLKPHDLNQPASQLTNEGVQHHENLPKRTSSSQEQNENFGTGHQAVLVEGVHESEKSPLNRRTTHDKELKSHANAPEPASPLIRRGPVKLPSRAIAKSYRVYKSQVNRLTDIVRTSVDCNSFASINAVVQTLDSVGYVRPLTMKPVDSAKPLAQNGSSQGNASSSMLARCMPTGLFASMFAPKQQHEPYEDAPTGKILEILRVRNRFAIVKEAVQLPDGFRGLVSQVKVGLQEYWNGASEGTAHWSGGFRDLAFKVKVGFQESPTGAPKFVPMNRWGDPSVKTFVCELQIHHQDMLPSKVLECYVRSLDLASTDEAASQVSKHRAEEFHKRYVKMRDVLAS